MGYDALDECKSSEDLYPLVSKVDPHFLLRVFVTSRPNAELANQVHSLSLATATEDLSPAAILPDIRRYVESGTDFPSMKELSEGSTKREALIEKILEKSEGNFLWVGLVLKQLRRIYSPEASNQIFEDVPKGMNELYSSILSRMSEMPYGKSLAKAILQWDTCAKRVLTISEMSCALGLQVDDKVTNLQHQIASLCGHLVYVDQQSRIQIVHQTARSYLHNPENHPEFTFHEKEAHRQLTLICLKYLCSAEMKAPRVRRPSNVQHAVVRSPFLNYAAKYLHQHINQSSSEDELLSEQLYRFVSSPGGYILSWIEYVAQEGDLTHLIKLGVSLRDLIKRRSKYIPAIENGAKVIDSWAMDLVRIMAKFGYNLSRFPPSIHHIIPPFCPHDSAPYQQFGRSQRGILVEGLSVGSGDDCVACVVFHKQTATALSCSGNYYAIGTSDYSTTLYHASTCQEFAKLEHCEPAKVLSFNPSGQLLAGAGRKALFIWDVGARQVIRKFELARPAIAACFAEDSTMLMAACHDNSIYSFPINNGESPKKMPWFMDIDHAKPTNKQPVAAAFSLGLELFAFVTEGVTSTSGTGKTGFSLELAKSPEQANRNYPFMRALLCFIQMQALSL